MTRRLCLPVLIAAGSALSGCINIECPAEFARPMSRERYCGHTGDVAAPAVYMPYVQPNPVAQVPPPPVRRTVVVPAEPTVQAAPNEPVAIELMPPLPPAGSPTPIR